MRRPTPWLLLAICACTASPPLDYQSIWNGTPIDSATVAVDYRAPVDSPLIVAVIKLGATPLGDNSWGVIRKTEHGFMARVGREARMVPLDSSGRPSIVGTLNEIADPIYTVSCSALDSVLVIEGATQFNTPLTLHWIDLSGRASETANPPQLVTLPAGGITEHCLRLGDHWAIAMEAWERPMDFSSARSVSLLEVKPGADIVDGPVFTLHDRMERVTDSAGAAIGGSLPWAAPQSIQSDDAGQLYVLDGPTGVIRILQNGASGPRLRGITPRSVRPVTRPFIDSVQEARWQSEVRMATDRNGVLSARDSIDLSPLRTALRWVPAKGTVPEVERLMVGGDGSFALLASEWLVPSHSRWDLFGREGAYLGAVLLDSLATGVGVQDGTLWYSRVTPGDSTGAVELVRVRPRTPRSDSLQHPPPQ